MRVSKVYEFALARWGAWGTLYSRLIIHMSSTGNAEKLSAVGSASVEAIVLTFVAVEQTTTHFVALQRGQECPRHTSIAVMT
jgi:hypothetical protein